ncbi:uncharacterized protein PV06_07050 [Exophiala oligosperma]|uniref:PRKR-interacting protein 1 n=2 Tax=Chaetothyriales TaxID=34395 RepID=A0A0D2E160_9EURO|nr:uncharacterized protein PV06_07050 [Exophiala oligosperma]KAJ9634756.1 hypothetical protein H2204_006205 [Knufia peltigerae]KIW41499.1 hypothetical protein PV06_07050 [Exophiala oligosperma]
MSEPIPESIPTSADPRSRRPVKRARGTNTALAAQAHEVETLFLDPERPVHIPAVSSETKRAVAAPPEIVANVQGSSAGAGSGEFHVYKASRRREYERLRVMDEEAKKEEEDEAWAKQERERREKDEEKTRRNREKRMKKKGKKGNGGAEDKGKDGTSNKQGGSVDGDQTTNGVKRKVGGGGGGLQIPRRGSRDDDQGSDFGVAELAKEVGITIHDDD